MSLTDDWKAGKLNEKSIYWADLGNEKIEPAEVDKYGYLFGLDGCFYSPERCEYVKILAACDYDHFVELNEKVKELEKEVAKGDEIIGKLLNEGHAAIEKNRQLRQLLKECKEVIAAQKTFFAPAFECCKGDYNRILTRITEVLK